MLLFSPMLLTLLCPKHDTLQSYDSNALLNQHLRTINLHAFNYRLRYNTSLIKKPHYNVELINTRTIRNTKTEKLKQKAKLKHDKKIEDFVTVPKIYPDCFKRSDPFLGR